MNSSTHKKVVVRYRQGGFLCGFVATAELAPATPLALLTAEGQALDLDWAQVQAVLFVSDWERAESLPGTGTSGQAGPRMPGLWVRIHCRGRNFEGILASELLDLAAGAWLSPLYRDSVWQRLYLPRTAIEQVTALEVVRPPRRRRSPAGTGQIGLFGPGEGQI